MKKKYFCFIILAIFTFQYSFANSINSQTIREQLENLNQQWKGKQLDYPVLNEKFSLTGDVALIQMHLSLVEKTLRNKNVDHLSNEQKQNRLACLTILHDYWVNGVFPKNLFHDKRTPYFIDKFGTACAVGQLIISTGNGDFAKKIMTENNNAYISELNLKYPEINKWATHHGFSIDELAWIQPCYCSPSGTAIVNVSCNGGYDGSFVPSFTGGTPPYSYSGTCYKWDGTSWMMLNCGTCNLAAGYYKSTATDAVGATLDFFATITEPAAITPTLSVVNDNSTCNGSLIVATSGGTPSYTYSWMPGGFTNDTISNLCPNTYSLTINDSKGCIATETVVVNNATSIKEIHKTISVIFPNPVSEEINFSLGNFYHPNTTFASIYNSIGQKVIYKKVDLPNESIDLSKLENGIYFIRIDNASIIESHQFIKNE